MSLSETSGNKNVPPISVVQRRLSYHLTY